MAHNLHFNEQTNGHSFFSVREKAWHGLGKVVSDYPNSQQALAYAGLDFRVEKRTMFTSKRTLIPGTERLVIPHCFATVRLDTEQVLGVVGSQYKTVQNRDAFAFFDAIVAFLLLLLWRFPCLASDYGIYRSSASSYYCHGFV